MGSKCLTINRIWAKKYNLIVVDFRVSRPVNGYVKLMVTIL